MNAKAIALLAGGLVAAGGVGTAIGDLGSDDSERERAFSELEVRKDDGSDDVELVDDEDGGRGDGSDRGGGDERSRDRSVQTNRPEQDPNTGSGDRTAGTAPSPAPAGRATPATATPPPATTGRAAATTPTSRRPTRTRPRPRRPRARLLRRR